MIKIKKYDNEEVEKKYFYIVANTVKSKDQKDIVKYLKKHFSNLMEGEITFEKWILAEYETLKEAYNQLPHGVKDPDVFVKDKKDKKRFKALYKRYYKAYDKVRSEYIGDQRVNIFLVKKSNMNVCPYCNRNYITARGESVSGAQLDHFISRSEYPIFALCLYNLVPCCSVCNLTKLTKELEVSPFASEMDDNSFTFTATGILPGEQPAVKIKAKNAQLEKNIEVLHLQEAYDFHSDDLKELVELKEMYPETQISEICDLINGERRLVGKANLTSTDIRDMVFGKQVPYEEYGKKPLAKFRHDILKDLGVYTR